MVSRNKKKKQSIVLNHAASPIFGRSLNQTFDERQVRTRWTSLQLMLDGTTTHLAAVTASLLRTKTLSNT